MWRISNGFFCLSLFCLSHATVVYFNVVQGIASDVQQHAHTRIWNKMLQIKTNPIQMEHALQLVACHFFVISKGDDCRASEREKGEIDFYIHRLYYVPQLSNWFIWTLNVTIERQHKNDIKYVQNYSWVCMCVWVWMWITCKSIVALIGEKNRFKIF